MALRRLALDNILECEDLRARIARTLHDDLGQALTVLNLHLYWLSRHCAGDASIQNKLDEMQQVVSCANRAIQQLTTECQTVTPPAGATPADVFNCIVRQHRRRHGIDCEIAIPDQLPELPDGYIVVLARILLRILSAHTQRGDNRALRITLVGNDGGIVLDILSHGAGVREPPSSARSLAAAHTVGEWVTALGGCCVTVEARDARELLRIALPLSARGCPMPERRILTD